MNREATQQVKVSLPVKRKLAQQQRQLQADAGRAVTYSQMLAAMLEQIVYEHLLAALKEGEQT